MRNIRAFPIKEAIELVDTFGKEKVVVQQGMTLLDYFAGQVLIANLANPEWLKVITSRKGEDYPKMVAEISYRYAEAMLEEREKRSNKNDECKTNV